MKRTCIFTITLYCNTFLLVACGSTNWYLMGKTSQQFHSDSLKCQTIAVQYYGSSDNVPIGGGSYFKTCMLSLGYTIAD
jgi:hypothetical protein